MQTKYGNIPWSTVSPQNTVVDLNNVMSWLSGWETLFHEQTPIHNITKIHNNVMWNWQYSTEYFPICRLNVGKYSLEYCQSYRTTLLWISITSCHGCPDKKHYFMNKLLFITLFKSLIMFYETHNISRNIPWMHIECEKYSAKYCQSHRTLLWIW